MTQLNYQPTCSLQALQQRAQLYRQIRDFFLQRQVLEVETPVLSQAAVTDVHLQSIAAQRQLHGKFLTHYLQTSPEFPMKRLLASGSGAIYQICKVFRNDEHGRKHNSEFTMLEWYRPGFDLNDLMAEVTDLLNTVLPAALQQAPQQLSYKQAFIQRLKINPLQADLAQLKALALDNGLDLDLGDDRLAYIDLLFSHCIEPELGRTGPVYLRDFPPEMASLAKVRQDEDGEWVAARFELYINGLELANAYDELIDATVLAERFAEDNAQREARALSIMPVDHYLLAALADMPACAGIALGIDRLLMVIGAYTELDQVIAFPAEIS